MIGIRHRYTNDILAIGESYREIFSKLPNLAYADLRNANLQGADLSFVNLENAILDGANLRNAELVGTNLAGADLYLADLTDANLNGAKLEGTNCTEAILNRASFINTRLDRAILVRAILTRADFQYASLKDAVLSGASMRMAILHGTDLTGAKLMCADLSGAKLHGANLCCSDLNYALLSDVIYDSMTAFFALACPEEGEFIGWKRVGCCIVKLKITENAKRSSATTRKCRCSEALVLDIQTIDGKSVEGDEVINYNYTITKYSRGKMVYPDFWDDNRWAECSHGIHFFITRDEAVNYI